MERVNTLIKKLQEQSEGNASVQALLGTVQMLQAELMLKAGNTPVTSGEKVSIILPVHYQSAGMNGQHEVQEEKEVQVLQVDEREIEEELAQIKKHAETINAFGQHNREPQEFDPLEEVPTLAHQDPMPKKNRPFQGTLDYPEAGDLPESLNDRLKQVRTELSQTLGSSPIKDLRKAINVNERFLFINELFRGDEAMYERSIKTIQNFSIYAEAEFWIRRELKVKIGWLDSDPVVKEFDELVRRRFI